MPRPKKLDTTTTPSPPSPPNAAAEAFAKVEPELAAASLVGLDPNALDVGATVAAIKAARARMIEHRATIVALLPHHPIDKLDELETYAEAAWYAHLVNAYMSAGPEAAKSLVDEATKLRQSLLIAAEALAHRSLLDADAVAKLRKSTSPADEARDLVTLASLFKSAWSAVSSKTAVDRSELERAIELGPAVSIVLSYRKHSGKSVDSLDQRNRAYVLLTDAYDTCRQAITYIRWKDGDADTIAPPLQKKRGARRAGKKPEEDATGPDTE
jgi:hypothetical protein